MSVTELTEQLNTMYATTYYLRKKEVINNAFNATPFWYLLKKHKGIEYRSGGRAIQIDLEYAKNETVQFIRKGGSVTLADTDPLTSSFWDWKYMTGHIIRYFADFQQNRGEAAIKSKVNSDINNLQSSLTDTLESRLFADGTDDGGASIDGLGNIVSTTTTSGTVGSINKANYSWWRNQATDMTGYPATVYLRKKMSNMFNKCGKRGEGVRRFPTIIVCAQNVHELYEDETLEISRIMIGDRKIADLGFGDIAFKGRPMVWSPSCGDNLLYMLNTYFMKFVIDPIENFNLGEWLPIVNQPRDRVAHTMTVCNLTTGALDRHGVMSDITEGGTT